jgi:hypothetical protein
MNYQKCKVGYSLEIDELRIFLFLVGFIDSICIPVYKVIVRLMKLINRNLVIDVS